MTRSPRSTGRVRRDKSQPTSSAPSVVGSAGRRSAWEPTGAAAGTTDAPAPIAGEGTLDHQGAGSDCEDIEAQWKRLWDAAPDPVRHAFEISLSSLARCWPFFYGKVLPHVERRVEELLELHLRRLVPTSGGGR